MSKQTNTRVDPRIAPVEMIVTRTKSAQIRMQLRDKDRSMTKITDLLKSPTNKTTKLRKRVKKPSPTVKKVLVPKSESDESVVNPERFSTNEYYPDKLRRKFEEKRVFLRPKYESTTIVKLNKRKLCTPQKGFLQDDTLLEDSPASPKSSPVFAELSMEEVVRIVEETESLDDEDLMEILTCPSPVWWEDPPDGEYVEEPIYRRKPEPQKQKRPKAKDKPKADKVPNPTKEIVQNIEHLEITNTDDRFLKKRSKLETVLGSIKNRHINRTDSIKETNLVVGKKQNEKQRKRKTISRSNKSLDNGTELKETIIDNVKELNTQNNEKQKRNNLVNVKDKRNTESNEKQRRRNNFVDNVKDERNTENENQRKRKKLSESNESLSDVSIVEEDVLKDFENIEIPIANKRGDSVDVISIKSETSIERSIEGVDVISIKSANSEVRSEETGINSKNIVTIRSEDKSTIKSENNEVVKVKHTENLTHTNKFPIKLEETIKSDDSVPNIPTEKEIPHILPPLIKRPKIDVIESPSIKSVSEESGTSISLEGDTISDTNIKFISDDDEVKHRIINVEHSEKTDESENIKLNNDDIKEDISINVDEEKTEFKNDLEELNNCDDKTLDVLKAIDKKEFITVYKIVSNDVKDKSFVNKLKNIPEYSNYVDKLKRNDLDDSKYDGQLNSFFKKCKNVNRRKKNDDKQLCDTCEPKKSAISIAQHENVKYCLNCSAIFDTDDCNYCYAKGNDVKEENAD